MAPVLAEAAAPALAAASAGCFRLEVKPHTSAEGPAVALARSIKTKGRRMQSEKPRRPSESKRAKSRTATTKERQQLPKVIAETGQGLSLNVA